jgi:hypothetical protein
MDKLQQVLELLSLLSGPSLVIIGIIALSQLKIAKTDIRLRSKREAATLAASQCQKYFEVVIPLLNELDREFDRLKLPKYTGSIGDFTGEDLATRAPVWLKNHLIQIREKQFNIQTLVKAINSLEAFAVFFTRRVADEEMAFSSVGQTFCNSIEGLYPLIAMVRQRGKLGHYDNLVALYKLWASRVQRHRLEDEYQSIAAKLKTVPSANISAIGTEE